MNITRLNYLLSVLTVVQNIIASQTAFFIFLASSSLFSEKNLKHLSYFQIMNN